MSLHKLVLTLRRVNVTSGRSARHVTTTSGLRLQPDMPEVLIAKTKTPWAAQASCLCLNILKVMEYTLSGHSQWGKFFGKF